MFNIPYTLFLAAKNKLSLSEQSELLGHLREIASAPSESSCDREVDRLKESKVYKKSFEVRHYVDTRWLCIREVRYCTGHVPCSTRSIVVQHI